MFSWLIVTQFHSLISFYMELTEREQLLRWVKLEIEEVKDVWIHMQYKL
jgi:hypothetical protein